MSAYGGSRGVAKVGELRPSQLLYTFGIGAIVDLPHISVLVMGLDEWEQGERIEEPRLLRAVQAFLGRQVERLVHPPLAPDVGWGTSPLDPETSIGVPVAPFPRWLRCPACRLLAPIGSRVFRLSTNPYRPDRACYKHENCPRSYRPPVAVPARFLVACEHGHLDDFPWASFVHRGQTNCQRPVLELMEFGASGEAVDVMVKCRSCEQKRRMSAAFGEEAQRALPECRGRLPHLREYEADGCGEPVRTLLMGATNSWFPVPMSALSIPVSPDPLAQFLEEHWSQFEAADNPAVLGYLRGQGVLGPVADYSDEQLIAAIRQRREGEDAEGEDPDDLKGPEWRVLSAPERASASDDFALRTAAVPRGLENRLAQVVLADRLREVSALVGFTRIESPRDFGDVGDVPEVRRAPLASMPPRFLPAIEVRGEGIFIRFDEGAIREWCQEARRLERTFFEAHVQWRRVRGLEPAEAGFPGIRYVLLHSFSHALMRQLALECGYNAAGIRERIYAAEPDSEAGSMAGVLIYTAAPDSEGTLGGLVSLGEPERLGRHVEQALEQMRLCASDPLCAEHRPGLDQATLHGASCHACLFAPETACERGNKYLDRRVLVPTVGGESFAFFGQSVSA